MANYFTLAEKEEILRKLRTLCSVHDSQLPVACRLKDKDCFVIHDSEGNEKRASVKQMANAMAATLWAKDITYTVSCDTEDATVTIQEEDNDAENSSTWTGTPGTHLTITVSADDYHTEVFDVIACYDYTLYVTLYKEATETLAVSSEDGTAIKDVKVYIRKDGIGPWRELEADSEQNDENSTTFTISGHEEDVIYYKAVAPGYEWSSEASVTLSSESESSSSTGIQLDGTILSVSLESDVNFSFAGGKNVVLIETQGEPVGVTISVEDGCTWLKARYEELFIRDKGRCVIVAAANTTSEERTCTITVKQAVTEKEYTVTATQNAYSEES